MLEDRKRIQLTRYPSIKSDGSLGIWQRISVHSIYLSMTTCQKHTQTTIKSDQVNAGYRLGQSDTKENAARAKLHNEELIG
jgi:hypothetical protein